MNRKNRRRGRRRIHKKKRRNVYLPHELVIQILLRLPVKSLVRFKCVCKSWFSLISDPQFANSHFHLSDRTHTSRFVYMVKYSARSIDFEASIDDNSASDLGTLEFLYQEPWGILYIIGSCRGFVVLHRYSNIYLWNPSTGLHKQIPLPIIDSYYPTDILGFGYDKSRDDYSLVSMIHDVNSPNISSHLYFFSLRANTWKIFEVTHFPYTIDPYEHSAGLHYNTAIHWLAFRHDLSMHFIFVFDLMERKVLDMPLPADAFDNNPEYYHLWVFGEFISLWVMDYHNNNTTIEIWVMNEYGVHSSWTKTLVLPIDFIPTEYFRPLCSTKSGDIIGTDGSRGLVKYNDKGRLRELYCYSDERGGDKIVMYTESLLSLPGGDNEQA